MLQFEPCGVGCESGEYIQLSQFGIAGKEQSEDSSYHKMGAGRADLIIDACDGRSEPFSPNRVTC